MLLQACARHEGELTLSGKNLIRIPLARQSNNYTCGVAALQSILGYWGEDIREDNLARELKANPEDGVNYKNIVKALQRRGFNANVKIGASLEDLKQALDRGEPAIAAFQAWAGKKIDYSKDWEDGHYAVAVGYDSKNIYFMDPSTLGHYTFIPMDEFLIRWHDTDNSGKLIHFMIAISTTRPPVRPDAILPLE